MNGIYALIIAFSMYSAIPMPKIEWTKERMRYMLCFFPLVGAASGILLVLWKRFGAVIAGTGALHTAVLVLIPFLVTGGIHMDGFLDTADALASYRSREEKLQILKDSHTGAFALIAGLCYMVLAFGAYGELTQTSACLLALGFVLSRALSALSVVTFQMAKNSGLVASFSDAAQKRAVAAVMCGYILACLALYILLGGLQGAVCFCAALLVFCYYRFMSYRQFGGITGDLAGFFVQVCELAIAVTAAVTQNLLH